MVKRLPLAVSLLKEGIDLQNGGDVMSILRIEDYSGSAQVVAFPKVFAQCQQFLAVDMVVKVRGRIDADEKGVQIIADRIMPLKVNYSQAKHVAIHIYSQYDTPENSEALKRLLTNTSRLCANITIFAPSTEAH